MKIEKLPSTELIRKAISDGVETVSEYDKWLAGYVKGYGDRQTEIMDGLKSAAAKEITDLKGVSKC